MVSYQKGIVVVSVVLVLLMFSVSFSSAFWPFDWFKKVFVKKVPSLSPGPYSGGYETGYGQIPVSGVPEVSGSGYVPPKVIVPPASVSNCNDTDGGRVYNIKGTATSKEGGATYVDYDRCLYQNRSGTGTIYQIVNSCEGLVGCNLQEAFCINGKVSNEVYICPTGKFCIDGACINGSAGNVSNCIDTDGGLNYFVKGNVSVDGNYVDSDWCTVTPQGDLLNEKYCRADGSSATNSTFCQYGCENGACVQQPTAICTDTDGRDYFVNGTITTNAAYWQSPAYDRCMYQLMSNPGQYISTPSCSLPNGYGSPCYVQEYYCSGTTPMSEVVDCNGTCINGACARPTISSCEDSDGGKDLKVKGVTSGDVFCTSDGNCQDMTVSVGDTCIPYLRPEGMAEAHTSLIKEYSCENGKVIESLEECMSGCSEGACFPNILATIGTARNYYSEGESLTLSDPQYSALDTAISLGGKDVSYSSNLYFVELESLPLKDKLESNFNKIKSSGKAYGDIHQKYSSSLFVVKPFLSGKLTLAEEEFFADYVSFMNIFDGSLVSLRDEHDLVKRAILNIVGERKVLKELYYGYNGFVLPLYDDEISIVSSLPGVRSVKRNADASSYPDGEVLDSILRDFPRPEKIIFSTSNGAYITGNAIGPGSTGADLLVDRVAADYRKKPIIGVPFLLRFIVSNEGDETAHDVVARLAQMYDDEALINSSRLADIDSTDVLPFSFTYIPFKDYNSLQVSVNASNEINPEDNAIGVFFSAYYNASDISLGFYGEVSLVAGVASNIDVGIDNRGLQPSNPGTLYLYRAESIFTGNGYIENLTLVDYKNIGVIDSFENEKARLSYTPLEADAGESVHLIFNYSVQGDADYSNNVHTLYADVVPQSKITNYEDEPVDGNLTIAVLKLSNFMWNKPVITPANWRSYRVAYLISKEMSLPANGMVKLDSLFNPLDVKLQEGGNYAVYAQFDDSYGHNYYYSWKFNQWGQDSDEKFLRVNFYRPVEHSAYLTGDSVRFSVGLDYNLGGAKLENVSFIDENSGRVLCSINSHPYECTYNGIENGDYRVYAKAEDSEGFYNISGKRDIYVRGSYGNCEDHKLHINSLDFVNGNSNELYIGLITAGVNYSRVYVISGINVTDCGTSFGRGKADESQSEFSYIYCGIKSFSADMVVRVEDEDCEQVFDEKPLEFEGRNVCVDSDSKINSLIRGEAVSTFYFISGAKLESRAESFKDICLNENTLLEAGCSEGYGGYVPIRCANGCLNGTCIANDFCYDGDCYSMNEFACESSYGGGDNRVNPFLGATSITLRNEISTRTFSGECESASAVARFKCIRVNDVLGEFYEDEGMVPVASTITCPIGYSCANDKCAQIPYAVPPGVIQGDVNRDNLVNIGDIG